jgi:hypothetical protein
VAGRHDCFPVPISGQPHERNARLSWALDDHDTISCVSHATYQRAGAAGERFAAGVITAFFVVHFGVATSEIVRRRGSVS